MKIIKIERIQLNRESDAYSPFSMDNLSSVEYATATGLLKVMSKINEIIVYLEKYESI